ncbi:dGTP triphosphohydrolase, partial [Bacillus sp. DJP31]|uniref:dGTP triphosphohydrolase n=1 Tax=Bacillus sp. DJP31 TaxID=3409789 RepID=UPI003BB4C30C
MFNWNQLLSEERRKTQYSLYKEDFRNGFEQDYDTVVTFSSMRRLQDKTQVFPLQKNDFIHTRLTHSIQVSGVARSLGHHISTNILNSKLDSSFTYDHADKIPSLLATAGLVHDLGNCPFGHYGEYIIQNWFKEWFYSEEYLNFEKDGRGVTHAQKQDFLKYDGNPQTIRILSKLQFLNDHYGGNLTYATLSVLIKYPYSSDFSSKKFGYFQTEKDLFLDLLHAVGLKEGQRHPLTPRNEESTSYRFPSSSIIAV